MSWHTFAVIFYTCHSWFPFSENLIDIFTLAVDDLKANTEYTGYTVASSVVQWFWEVVKAFNKEDMARFLQFVTGTSKVILCIGYDTISFIGACLKMVTIQSSGLQ